MGSDPALEVPMLLSSLAIALALTQASQRDSLGPAKDLKILYAGAPGEEREERFMDFLEPWFAQVDPISLADLDAKSAAPYDVVIVDWKRQYVKGNPRDDAEAPI